MNNGQTCVIITYAYNAEKTIARTIESILSQTYINWVYYILDNGSTDNTGDIIRKYAEQHTRIIPLSNKFNHVFEEGNHPNEILAKHNPDDWFCSLDSDDEYKPGFLENMINFVNENNLDIAACGIDYIDSASGQFMYVRALNQNLILDSPKDYNDYFTKYHGFMRSTWCKLYKIAIIHKQNSSRQHGELLYGGDTTHTIEHFRNASRIGILAKSLHKYYVSLKTFSYKLDNTRIESDRILDDVARDFLDEKCGIISKENNDFLQLLYFNAIYDTCIVVLATNIPLLEKYAMILNIFASEHTQELLLWNGYMDKKKQLSTMIVEWIQKQNDSQHSHENNDVVAKIYTAIGL